MCSKHCCAVVGRRQRAFPQNTMQRGISALMLRKQPLSLRGSKIEPRRDSPESESPYDSLIPVTVFTFDYPRATHRHAITNTQNQYTSGYCDISTLPKFCY